MENSVEFLKKLKIELPYDPAILLLGTHPEKAMLWKGMCTLCSQQHCSQQTRHGKHLNVPLADEWMKQVWSRCTLEYYSATERRHEAMRRFPGGASGKEPTWQCRRWELDPWVGKIPWRRAWQPTPVFWPGESPWTEEPGGLQSMGSKTVGHDWSNAACIHTATWMDLEVIILSEVSGIKTMIVWISKRTQVSLFMKQKEAHRLWKRIYGYQRGKVEGGGINREFGININILLYVK